MLKVGLVGVGGISGAHIPAWLKMEDAELVALCDIRKSQMEKYPDIRQYTDFGDMLANEELDILDICLPTYLHAEYSIKALEKGINVICEKPISMNKEDVKRIYAIAEKMNVKFMVAQVLRFWPEYELLKEIYDTKRYGRLLSGQMSRLGNFPKWSWDNWLADEKRSGLVPYDLHVHDLDFMFYMLGKPKSVTASRVKTDKQDHINVMYNYDGFFVNAEAAWFDCDHPFEAGFRFQFEDAVVVNRDSMKIYEKGGKIIDFGKEATGDTGDINLPKSDAYGNEIRYFADCVANNKEITKITSDLLEEVIDTIDNYIK